MSHWTKVIRLALDNPASTRRGTDVVFMYIFFSILHHPQDLKWNIGTGRTDKCWLILQIYSAMLCLDHHKITRSPALGTVRLIASKMLQL